MLEMRGTFSKNPSRKRTDPKGSGPFELQPPTHLPQAAVPAWNYLVARLPLVAFYNCDEIAVEIAAKLLAQYWLSGELETVKELRQWLGKLGMTPGDRAKLDAKEPEGEKDPTAKYF